MNPQAVGIVIRSSLRMMVREPLVLVWNLGFPILFFHLTLNASGIAADPARIEAYSLAFCAYTVLMNAVYGVGMILLDWRESGFLLSFVQAGSAQARLLLGLIAGNALTTLVFLGAFTAFKAVMYGIRPGLGALALGAAAVGLTVVVGLASTLLNKARLKHRTISTILSVGTWLLLWDVTRGVAAEAGPVARALHAANPLEFCRRFLGLPVDPAPAAYVTTYAAALVLVWAIFARRLTLAPKERR